MSFASQTAAWLCPPHGSRLARFACKPLPGNGSARLCACAIGLEPMVHDQTLLHHHGCKTSAVRQRMYGKANCDDNSAVESCFKPLKAELVWHRNWQTRRKVEIALFLSHGLKSNHCRATEHISGFLQPTPQTLSNRLKIPRCSSLNCCKHKPSASNPKGVGYAALPNGANVAGHRLQAFERREPLRMKRLNGAFCWRECRFLRRHFRHGIGH